MTVGIDLGTTGSLALAFAKLGLTADADARAVRQAYARQLKQIDQATELEAFQTLREAYELALNAVREHAAAAHAKALPAAESPAAEPDPHLIDSTSLAEAAFDEFASRLAAGIASTKDATALLRQALERLVSLEAGVLFERRVADRLARGWQPGHEFLFDAACSAFHWTQDRRHLLTFGAVGLMLQEALIQRQAFFDQPAELLDRQQRLVRRLRDATPPSRTLRRDERPLLQVLVRRFPQWLPMVTSGANIEQWLGGPEALQAVLAMHEPSQPIETSDRQVSDWQVVGFLLWLALMAWRYFG